MLVRAPVYVFQGIGASLLQNLTRLHATGDTARFRRALAVGVSVMLAGSALTILFAVAIGPEALRAVFGPTFTADRMQLSILAIGVGLYLGGSVISQGLLAANRGAVACIGWIVALAVFLAVYAVSSGDPLSRISVAFLASAATNLTFGLGALAWTTGLGLFPARVDASPLATPSPVEHP
jgi:O-antigen/teichoic acid export membrane protein